MHSSRATQRSTKSGIGSITIVEKSHTMNDSSQRETLNGNVIEIVKWSELPEWQKDNEHIHSGYVKETNSYFLILKSLFVLHNESVNIFSHLIPGLCFLLSMAIDVGVVKRFPTTTLTDYIVINIFLFGAFTCLFLSSSFHCMKAHSLPVSIFGNKLDYLGIVVLIVSSMMSILYYGFFDNSLFLYGFSFITLSLGLACGIVSLKDKFRSRKWRPYRAALFVLFGLSAVFPILTGCWYYGVNETSKRVQLKWIVLEGVFYISGAGLYGSRIPEKLKPGYFDIWGNSHQIFHVLVVIASLCHFRALLGSYELVHTYLYDSITTV